MQQKAAVEVHRTGDVADRHDARLARLAAAAAQVDQLAGGGAAQCAPQIHARAARRRLPASAGARREPPCDAPGDALDLLQLAGIEGAEVLLGLASGVAWLASPLSAFAYVLVHAVVMASRSLAHLPGVLTAVTLPGIAGAVYYTVLGLAGFWILRRQGWAPRREWTGRGRELSLGLALGLGALSAAPVLGHNVSSTTLTWLGSGDSFLLQTHGETVLIDGAPHPLAYLEALGTTLPYSAHTIDLIVVTDPRASNVAALSGVLAHYRVRSVLDRQVRDRLGRAVEGGDPPLGVEYPSLGYGQWRDALRAAHVPVYALRTGAFVRLSGARVDALGPDAVCGIPRDCIGLLRLSLPGRTFLVAGAASRRELEEAVFRPVTLEGNVLVEGAAADTPKDFVDAVGPHRVLVETTGGDGLMLRKGTPAVLYRSR